MDSCVRKLDAPSAITCFKRAAAGRKLAAEIIDGYDEVTVRPSEEDPTVCLVEFGFSVAHGLNQIHLTVHITI